MGTNHISGTAAGRVVTSIISCAVNLGGRSRFVHTGCVALRCRA